LELPEKNVSHENKTPVEKTETAGREGGNGEVGGQKNQARKKGDILGQRRPSTPRAGILLKLSEDRRPEGTGKKGQIV